MVQAIKRSPALRIGVIGVGIMGSNHARVLAELPGVTVVGIADPGAAHRPLLAQIVGCEVCDNVEDLLKLGIDAAVIAAPTHLHHDIALTCIKRGVHVLVEKPIASNVEEGRAIVAAAERAGVTLMVGHVERFNPAVQAIKDAIKDEDILSIAITRVGPFPPRMSNVGVVIDLAVHDIDLIRWFTDSEIIQVQPQLKSAVAEREDIALLQFRTASGVLIHFWSGDGTSARDAARFALGRRHVALQAAHGDFKARDSFGAGNGRRLLLADRLDEGEQFGA